LVVTDWLDNISTVLFSLDIILMFFTAIEIPNDLPEMRLDKIAISYLKGYFCLDLLSTFPFDLILQNFNMGFGKENKLFRLVRIPRLYRLIKIIKLVRIARYIDEVLRW